jgi:hypothetical protein
MHQRALLFSALAVAANAQQVGTQKPETHPSLTWQKCTAAGSCTQQSGSVVIDANWRWLHSTKDTTNCYTGNTVGISTGSRIQGCSFADDANSGTRNSALTTNPALKTVL